MKITMLFTVSLILSSCCIPAAFAEDGAPIPASLSFQYAGLKWTQTKSKYSDDATARNATSVVSGDLVDSSVYATIAGKVNLYFYPFQDANTLVSVGYMLQDTWEVGVDLGLNATKVKEPKSELSSDLMGVFTTYTVPFEGFALENFAVLDFTRVEATTFNSATNEDDKSKADGTYLKFSSTAVVPIAKNAYYMGGFWVAAEQNKNHTTDVTKKGSQWGLMLAGLRITVE